MGFDHLFQSIDRYFLVVGAGPRGCRHQMFDCELFFVSIIGDSLLIPGSQAAGAFGFVASSGAWWILAAQILASVQFPISLPVGDMSTVFPAAKTLTLSEDSAV